MLGNRSSKRSARSAKSDAELDITSFMNLMIVLVPVLLMMMVFSRITVVELNLPGIAAMSNPQEIEAQVLEVQVNEAGLEVYFPQAYLVTSIPKTQEGHDYTALQETLKQIKQSLISQGVDKKDLSLLLQQDTDYQTIVTLIDTTRSYEDVLVSSVVQAELFPEVSLADAPVSGAPVSDAARADARAQGGMQ